jgi:hypothetical protein
MIQPTLLPAIILKTPVKMLLGRAIILS